MFDKIKNTAPGKKKPGVFYLFFNFLSIILFFLFWKAVAAIVNSPMIVPYPEAVFKSILKLIFLSSFWKAFFETFFRVVSAFFISAVSGFVVGAMSGRSEIFKNIISFPLSVIRSTPVAALILIAVFWVGSEKVPVFTAVLMALPVIVTSVSKGFENADRKLLEMAEIFNFSKGQRFFYIYLPSVLGNLKSALISIFSMCWKVVVAGEILALPKHSVGSLLYASQIHLETQDVCAYTVIIVVASWFLEKLLDIVLKEKNGKNS